MHIKSTDVYGDGDPGGICVRLIFDLKCLIPWELFPFQPENYGLHVYDSGRNYESPLSGLQISIVEETETSFSTPGLYTRCGILGV